MRCIANLKNLSVRVRNYLLYSFVNFISKYPMIIIDFKHQNERIRVGAIDVKIAMNRQYNYKRRLIEELQHNDARRNFSIKRD